MLTEKEIMRRVLVDPEMGCWLWLGAHSSEGYATISSVYGHRLMYRYRFGEIPRSLHVDHLCRNRGCINPDHLEAVTQAENNRRMWVAIKKDVCQRGHDLTNPANVNYAKGFRRYCRACVTLRSSERRAREAAART